MVVKQNILNTIRERLVELTEKYETVEFIPVTLEELDAYCNYGMACEDVEINYSPDKNGFVIPHVGELPLHCSFRNIPLRCKDAG